MDRRTNLRQFECLRAIITTGSMTQAAESLGISQPSASNLISNLELILGFKLFDRVKGRLVATPEAKYLLPDVARALDDIELAMQKATQIKENRLGDLTIASYPDIAIDFLPKVLSTLIAGRSSVQVRLLARRSEMMSGLLPTHEYDMAIVTQVADTQHLDVEELQLPCVVAFPPGQAPAEGRELGPQDLRSKRLITLMPSHPTVVQLAERFSQARVPYPGPGVETQTFESACGFVRRGVGVGLIDVVTSSRYTRGEIEVRRFSPEIRQSIYFLTPSDRPASKLLDAFRGLLRAEFQALTRKFAQS